MSLKHIKGNIFNTKCQTIVNTVNCVGIMGKGIALVHKLRYPKMFSEYQEHCEKKLIKPGVLWLYSKQEDAPWILNFPTKIHWKYPSKLEWIESGLQKFVEMYQQKGITSIAFPLLGTHNGGLDILTVKRVMDSYLSNCKIPIEIYDYDPGAPDDLFESFKNKWLSSDPELVAKITGIQAQYTKKITEILLTNEVRSMVTLVGYHGIGEKTMEKAFLYALNKVT
jgi:O-acetyl-ADP-ribose deacetylase (regulator of RNase III)